LEIQDKVGKKLVDFLRELEHGEAKEKVAALKGSVEAWASNFFMPGH